MNRREFLKRTAAAMGIGASSSLMLGALAGCDGSPPLVNHTLKEEHRPLIAALTELIIPETDTPGAIAAGVPDFIERIVSGWYTKTERQIFLDGLVQINDHCRRHFAKDFVACDQSQQAEALAHFEQLAKQYQPPPRGMFDRTAPEDEPFFNKIKELTVFGYFTSEIGATQALRWLPMPGQYIVDYPVSEVGRAWAN